MSPNNDNTIFPSPAALAYHRAAMARVKPIDQEMQAAAETLAAHINEGEYAALTPAQRLDLRGLSLALAAWADAMRAVRERIDAALRGMR